MSIMNDPRIVNLSLHRATRSTRGGDFAFACMENVRINADALISIRESRARLDRMFRSGKLFSIIDKLRNLCYAIDSANAEESETA